MEFSFSMAGILNEIMHLYLHKIEQNVHNHLRITSWFVRQQKMHLKNTEGTMRFERLNLSSSCKNMGYYYSL